MAEEPEESEEPRALHSTLNWLRAAVLGANDGIVSVASIILGAAGATSAEHTILIAGLAGLAAGAFSMAVGEYVSVSSQRDSERAYIAREKQSLQDNPEAELKELAGIYRSKGLRTETARQVARELTDNDPVAAHLEAEFHLDESELNNPWHAAIASFVAFTIGGLVPLITVLLVNAHLRIAVTFVAVLVALCITGYVSATIGTASRRRAIVRVVVGGALAMAATYCIGFLFGGVIG